MAKKIQKKTADSKKRKKIVLGRGLDALLPEPDTFADAEGKKPDATYLLCKTDLIKPNRFQPRMRFSSEELKGLSDSIKEQGIIQPLIIRHDEKGYELIAGERRLRAARLAGLDEVPVIIKDFSENQMLEVSIVENIQRENLNPIEEAEAYHRLITEFKLTQEEAAARVGKSRSAVANFLRIRQLPIQIKESIMDGQLSMGHARAILGLESTALQNAAWRTILLKGLSVRETESLVKDLKKEKKPATIKPLSKQEHYFQELSDNLSRHFGTKVRIKLKDKKGRVELDFYTNDDLDRLLGLLTPK